MTKKVSHDSYRGILQVVKISAQLSKSLCISNQYYLDLNNLSHNLNSIHYGLTGVSVLYQYLLAFAARDHKTLVIGSPQTNPGP
jgi:hypothetical protein